MRKRQKECVIRMHRYNREKNPEKFYHGNLCCFYLGEMKMLIS